MTEKGTQPWLLGGDIVTASGMFSSRRRIGKQLGAVGPTASHWLHRTHLDWRFTSLPSLHRRPQAMYILLLSQASHLPGWKRGSLKHPSMQENNSTAGDLQM